MKNDILLKYRILNAEEVNREIFKDFCFLFSVVTRRSGGGMFMMSNRQTGICFIEAFANTPCLQGVHHTHISGDHNDQ